MTKKSINSQVRDYLLGRLSEAEQLELEQQLSQHPEWIQEMRQMEDADFTQLYETYEKFGSDEVLQQLKLKVLENKQSHTAITLNPTQMAEDMKRNNGFIHLVADNHTLSCFS